MSGAEESKKRPAKPGETPGSDPLLDRTLADAAGAGDATGAAKVPGGPVPGGQATGAQVTGAAGRTGGVADEPTAEERTWIGRTLGSCVITDWIGRGAMGSVYKARQENLHRTVAVKTIRGDRVGDGTLLARFQREAQVVARFDTQHVVQIYDAGCTDGVHYLVMQYVPGGTVRKLALSQPGGVLTNEQAIRYLREAVLGLREAQRRDVLHRDIKPDNLLLDESGTLKIADFGIAKALDVDLELTASLDTVGTPLYMSPEQCVSEKLDFRSDMFSLGASFFYLMTGQPPIKATSIGQLIRTKTSTRHLSPAASMPQRKDLGTLSRIVERMTELDPKQRYPSYDALLEDLDALANGREPARRKVVAGGGGAVAVGRGDVEAAEGRAGVGRVVAGLVVLLVLVGGGYWYVRQSTTQSDEAGKTASSTETNSTTTNGGAAATVTPAPEPGPGPDPAPSPGPIDSPSGTHERPPAPDPDTEADARLVEQFEARLATLRATFERDGPDAVLADVDTARAEIPDRPRFAAVRAEFATFRDEVERAARTDAQAVEALATRLRQFQSDFDERGPDLVLTPLETARRAIPSRPRFAEIRAAYETLQNEVQQASRVAQTLVGTPPVQRPKPPFEDLEGLRFRVDDATSSLKRADGSYPNWLVTARAAKLASPEMLDAAITSLRELAERCTTAAGAADVDETVAKRVADDVALVRTGATKLSELYTDEAARIAAAFDGAALDAAVRRVEATLGERALVAEARAIAAEVARIDRVASWSASAARVRAKVTGLRGRVAEWKQSFAADAANVDAEIAKATAEIARIDELATAIGGAAAAFAAGRLEDARRAITGVADDPRGAGLGELEPLRTAIDTTAKAFEELRTTLRLANARDGLERAERSLSRIGAVGTAAAAAARTRLERLAELERRGAGMAAVAAGAVRMTLRRDDLVAEAAREVDVDAFFVQCTEVSHGEFVAFVAELRALGADAARAKYPGAFADVAAFERLASRAAGGGDAERDRLPVLGVRQSDAQAFAVVRGLQLPTHEQWWLAARGPVSDVAEYAWGDGWSDLDPQKRNFLTRAVDVRQGGVARRFRSAGATVHHLSGNAAEWLRAEPGADAGLVGGSFKFGQSPRESVYLRGERLQHAIATRPPPEDAGFRCVLEPRAVFGEAWAN